MQIQVFFIFTRSYFSLNFFVAVKNEIIKMHSTCFGIMGGHGNFVFNLVVKLFDELGYLFEVRNGVNV
jgi:hypothetical protein